MAAFSNFAQETRLDTFDQLYMQIKQLHNHKNRILGFTQPLTLLIFFIYTICDGFGNRIVQSHPFISNQRSKLELPGSRRNSKFFAFLVYYTMVKKSVGKIEIIRCVKFVILFDWFPSIFIFSRGNPQYKQTAGLKLRNEVSFHTNRYIFQTTQGNSGMFVACVIKNQFRVDPFVNAFLFHTISINSRCTSIFHQTFAQKSASP